MKIRHFFIAIVSIYGLLSLIAAVGGMAEDGFHGSLVLFIVSAIALLVSPWIPNTFPWLLAGLVGLHVAALWQGFSQDSFTPSHHIVRTVVSVAIITIYFRTEQ